MKSSICSIVVLSAVGQAAASYNSTPAPTTYVAVAEEAQNAYESKEHEVLATAEPVPTDAVAEEAQDAYASTELEVLATSEPTASYTPAPVQTVYAAEEQDDEYASAYESKPELESEPESEPEATSEPTAEATADPTEYENTPEADTLSELKTEYFNSGSNQANISGLIFALAMVFRALQ